MTVSVQSAKIASKIRLSQLVAKKAILTCKQKKSSACFDQAISSAAADAQINTSIVQEHGNTVENHIF